MDLFHQSIIVILIIDSAEHRITHDVTISVDEYCGRKCHDLDFKAIGLKIKERRKSLGITQESIANALDVNPSHISNIECGRANPSLTTLIKIANLLQCSVDYFISAEYTYKHDPEKEKSLDEEIMNKLKYCNIDKKNKVLKIIDLL